MKNYCLHSGLTVELSCFVIVISMKQWRYTIQILYFCCLFISLFNVSIPWKFVCRIAGYVVSVIQFGRESKSKPDVVKGGLLTQCHGCPHIPACHSTNFHFLFLLYSFLSKSCKSIDASLAGHVPAFFSHLLYVLLFYCVCCAAKNSSWRNKSEIRII